MVEGPVAAYADSRSRRHKAVGQAAGGSAHRQLPHLELLSDKQLEASLEKFCRDLLGRTANDWQTATLHPPLPCGARPISKGLVHGGKIVVEKLFTKSISSC